MGSFSGMHIFLLVIILLVFFGPSRLPKAGQSIGEAIRNFKKGLNGDEIDVTDRSKHDNLSSGSGASAQDPLAQKQKDKTRQDS